MPKLPLAIKIENVVATGALKHRIDLAMITRAFPQAEYNPKKFAAVIFRKRSMKRQSATFLIFGSGKIVCVGARSEDKARTALHNLIQELRKGGIHIVGKLEIQIRNIVATASLSASIDLLQLYLATGEMQGRAMYEPEQFPGLIYRMDNPKVVFLMYSTGKIVCLGAKTEESVHHAITKLQKELIENDLMHQE